MSGIDEQNRDVTPCGCELFRYWTMVDENIVDLGYLNPNKWLSTGGTLSINRIGGTNSMTKDDFISKIVYFHCEWCKRNVGKGHPLFDELLSDVRTRWNIGHVWNR